MVAPAPALAPCSRCRSPLEDGDLRCAICSLPVPAAAATAAPAARARILRCTECGAAIAFDAAAQAPRCGFCSATMAVEQPADPVEVAQLRIPFAVARDAAVEAMRGWLGTRGFFAPRTLREDAVLESMQPLRWAGWIVHARGLVSWTADSDAGSRRSDWAPHAGEVPLRFDALCIPATRGLRHDECRTLIPHYDLARAVPVAAAIPGEVPAMIESFDAQRSAARGLVQAALENTAKAMVQPHIPGRRFRNIHVSCLLEGQTTDRVALPAWILSYRYKDAPYRAIVHGQRADVVLGTSPTDWTKVALVVLAVAAAIAAIIAIVSAAG